MEQECDNTIVIAKVGTDLHKAVSTKNTAKVDQLLLSDSEAGLDTQNTRGQTALHRACSRGSDSIVRALLDHGARADIVDEYGDTPLHDASVKNHHQIVKYLLEIPETKNAILDTQNSEGQTALHAACLKGSTDVVEILLDHGAATDIVDDNGDDAFNYAVKNNNDKTVNCLLMDLKKHEVNLSIKYNKGKKTTLHFACKFGFVSVVKILLDLGMRTDVVDEDGNIALHYAVKKNHTEVVQLFQDSQTEQSCQFVDLQNKDGRTLLHYACFNGFQLIVQKALELGVQFDVKDDNGETPLHWAVMGEQQEVLELLLGNQNNQEIDINAANNERQTALHMASKTGNMLLVKTLLDHGAKHCLEEGNGSTAFDIATDLLESVEEDEEEQKERYLEVFTVFLDKMTFKLSDLNNQYKEDKTAMHFASKYGLKFLVEKLLERGARIDMVDNDGDTALHEAARENPVAVNLLLNNDKALVNRANNTGRTPLHYAAFYGCVEVVNCLLDSGAACDLVDDWGDSPLHDAAGRNHPEVVELLLESQGVHIDTANRNGQTPLHIACLSGALSVINILLDHGADSELLDMRNHSALQNALIKNHPDIVKIFAGRNVKTADLINNLATIVNHREIVRFVIEKVDFEFWKDHGDVLLKSAEKRHDKEMITLLLDKGVKDVELYDDCEGTSESEADSDDDSDVDSGEEFQP